MKKTCQTFITIVSFFIIFNLFATSAFSQYYISGYITGDVQAGVNVDIASSSCGTSNPVVTTTTNSSGYYAVFSLSNGSYTVAP